MNISQYNDKDNRQNGSIGNMLEDLSIQQSKQSVSSISHTYYLITFFISHFIFYPQTTAGIRRSTYRDDYVEASNPPTEKNPQQPCEISAQDRYLPNRSITQNIIEI